jgi:putative protease
MKILCPVDRLEEVAPLADLGAGEFYGGYLPPSWKKTFSLHASANRRSFPEAQITDEKTLAAVISAVHGKGARFYLTVNSPFYLREQMGPLLEIIDGALDLGADAVIAADIGLILELRKRRPSVPVHLSTMAEVTNSAAADFYRHLGISRITLPRHLSLHEIRAVVDASPGMRFDVFILYGQCANAEGLCTFSHDDPGRVWPCVQPYRMGESGKLRGDAGKAAPALCAQMLWDGTPRGEACGLCALPDLAAAGVEAVKIVGRGTSRERKEWAVATVKALLDGQEGDGESFRSRARELYLRRFPRGCRSTLCYFPELLPPGGE